MDQHSASLVSAMGAWPAEPGGGRENARSRVTRNHLELVWRGHGHLVDVTAENQFGARRCEPVEYARASREWQLRGAPRGTGHRVVEDGHPKRPGRRLGEHGLGVGKLGIGDASALVEPRANGSETDGLELG